MAFRFRSRSRADVGPKRARPYRLRPEPPALAPEWVSWVVENLTRGAAPEDVRAELVRRDVSPALASRLIDELVQQPWLGRLRELTRRGRRLELVQRLLTLQQRDAAQPEAVERRTTPPVDEFFDRYYAPGIPVVFTDLVTRWPAFGKWSPEYFAARFGDTPLHMTDERESDPIYDARTEAHTRATTMAAYVERVLAASASNDFYLVAKNRNVARPELRALFDDIALPDDWFRADHVIGSSALWFGPAGTLTPLHHDASSILFCQVYGRKRFWLASPLEIALCDDGFAMYSACDPEAPDRDPRFRSVLFKQVELLPGDALYIPAGYWHHVRALDVSISLGVNHFARENNFDAWYRPVEVP